MSKIRFTLTAIAMVAFTLMVSSAAQAQATRTWVSGTGDDVNPCSRTAPCKTFAGAIPKTAKDGEINALDPGGFGGVTITKSITIDGTPFMASALTGATNTIIINITSATDVRKSVTLRGLSIQGIGQGLRGINIVAANSVYVTNCLIEGMNGSPGDGITDSRSAGGFLEVNNTGIINNSGTGINVNPSAGSTQINVHIANSYIQGNGGKGFLAGSNVKATVFNSVFSQNVGGGVFAQQTAGGTTEVAVDQCVVSNTLVGFTANTANSVIRVSNTTAMNNGGGLAVVNGGGLVSSYGTNNTGGIAFPSPPTVKQ